MGFPKAEEIVTHSVQVSSPSVNIADKVIQQVGSTHFLGLTIDDCHSWDAHVNNISKTLNSGIFA